MKALLPTAVCALLIAVSTACTRTDQENARDSARKLERETKQDAQKANARIDNALKDRPADANAAMNQAGAKLDNAAHIAKEESAQAAQKLSHVALLARVKAKLVSDLGLSTASAVNVSVNGDIVTLTGTVPNEDRKNQAQQSVSQVGGVAKVVNHLELQP